MKYNYFLMEDPFKLLVFRYLLGITNRFSINLNLYNQLSCGIAKYFLSPCSLQIKKNKKLTNVCLFSLPHFSRSDNQILNIVGLGNLSPLTSFSGI